LNVKLIRLVGLSLAALTAACSGKTTQNEFSVALSFAPNPPVKGFDTLTVRVTDPNGNPITGARVRIKSNMPAMSMSGPSLTATDSGAGSYTARGNLQYATTYVFDVTAMANGATGTAHVTQSVK
jgi:nitrogen fixation protein FixH